MAKQKIIKLKDTTGTVAYFEDGMNWFPDLKGLKKYKEELEGHKYKEVYIGIKKNNNTLPFNIDYLFDEFTTIRPNTFFTNQRALKAYVKNNSGTFIFDQYFQEPFEITWERAKEEEKNKITNKYKPIGTAARGTSLLFKIIGTVIAYIFATNAIYWWLS